MSLSGQQRKKLQEALIDAFPTKASLEQMLFFELNKNLDAISGEGNLESVIFNLIKIADSQGWVEALIHAAYKSNNGNLLLKAFVEEQLISPFIALIPDTSTEFKTKLTQHKKILILGNKYKVITGIAIFIIGLASYSIFTNFPYMAQVINCHTKNNNESAFDCVRIGFKYYETQDYKNAIVYYNLALAINEKYADAYNYRSIVYGTIKNFPRAIEDANKAIELNPNNANFYYNRGFTYQQKGDIQRAKADFHKALELNPNEDGAKRKLNDIEKIINQ